MEKGVNKIRRTDEDLILAFKEHLDLLKDHIEKIRSGDMKYCKSALAELRLLVHKSKSNKPLLIYLAKRYQITPEIHRDVPPFKKDKLNLQEFLDEIAFASGTKKVRLTNSEFIALASQQEGSAHEDLTHDYRYAVSKGEGLLIGDVPVHMRLILGLSECIYSCGLKVFKQLVVIKKRNKDFS